MPAVRITGVSRSFGGRTVLDGLDLHTADGELTVVVGPSGCGKTTLLRIVAGLDAPDTGTIHIGERDVTSVAPSERDVAMVFQHDALFPHLSVAENIGFGLAVRRIPKSERVERVGVAAETVGCSELLHRRPEGLSGGERRRVALARALVRQPSVFLLDEPLTGLDAQLRVAMRVEIRQLQRRVGITSLLVTHDQVEALTMGDRVAVVGDGVVLQSGTPEEVYRRPSDRYVATFLGSPAMNVMGARHEGDELVAGPFRVRLTQSDRAALGDSELELGVRPEDVRLGAAAQDSMGGSAQDGTAGKAVVALAEMAGSETFLHLDTDSGRVVVRAPAGSTGRASISPAPARACVFDASTGRTLLFLEGGR